MGFVWKLSQRVVVCLLLTVSGKAPVVKQRGSLDDAANRSCDHALACNDILTWEKGRHAT